MEFYRVNNILFSYVKADTNFYKFQSNTQDPVHLLTWPPPSKALRVAEPGAALQPRFLKNHIRTLICPF